MIFIALILSLIAAFALLRMLRSARKASFALIAKQSLHCAKRFALASGLSSARAASFALLEELSTAGLRQLRSARAASFALIAKQSLHCAKRFALLALPALLCVACSDLREQPELQAEPVGDTFLTISLRYDSGKPSRAGRADDDGEVIPGNGHPDAVYPNDDVYAYGSEAENTIKSITIFVGDLESLPAEVSRPENADGIVAKNDGKFYTATRLTLGQGQVFKLENAKDYTLTTLVTGDNAKRDKVVYVGANLSQDQVDYICKNGVSAAYNFQNISMSVIDEVASSTNGFAMFCTHPVYYHFEPGTNQTPLPFSLRRIMAKILVTVRTNDPDAQYPHAVVQTTTNGVPDATPSFQVRVSEIKFVANSLNKSTYFFQNVEGTGTSAIVKDPNWGSFTNTNNFIYHPLHSWYNYLDFFRPVITYNEGRMPSESTINNQDNWYTEGIYVPENCFDASIYASQGFTGTDEEIAAQAADLAEQNVTHVIIRALITPMKLQVNRGLAGFIQDEGYTGIAVKMQAFEDALNDDEYIFEFVCASRQESDQITQCSLDYEGYSGLVAESFLYKDGKFYCYSAAKYESQHADYLAHVGQADAEEHPDYETGVRNDVKFPGFTLFTDGYAHYKVYLNDNLGEGDNHKPNSGTQAASATEWRESQIYRNTYYILTIDAFKGINGGIDPTEEMIEVHTQTIDPLNSWYSNDNKLSDSDNNADFPKDDEP